MYADHKINSKNEILFNNRQPDHSSVFPLLHALTTGKVDATGSGEKRKASTWAGRALLEAGLNRMCDQGIMKL